MSNNNVYSYGYPEEDIIYYKIDSEGISEFEIGYDPGWTLSMGFVTGQKKLLHTELTKPQLRDLHKLLTYVLNNVIEVE